MTATTGLIVVPRTRRHAAPAPAPRQVLRRAAKSVAALGRWVTRPARGIWRFARSLDREDLQTIAGGLAAVDAAIVLMLLQLAAHS